MELLRLGRKENRRGLEVLRDGRSSRRKRSNEQVRKWARDGEGASSERALGLADPARDGNRSCHNEVSNEI